MSGPKRTIYFMEPVVLDAKGKVSPIQVGFWDALHDHVSTLQPASRSAEIFGRRIDGEAAEALSPARKYLYVGKHRPKADWPHATDASGVTGAIDSSVVSAIIEYAYLLPVPGTNYVGLLRSSGGATFSALEAWLTSVCPKLPQGGSVVLRPYVRKDQLERLAKARGASKVELKIDPNTFGTKAPVGGDLAGALAEAQEIAGGGVSVELSLSFGRATPSEAGSENLAKQVQALLKSGIPLQKAKATVVNEDEHGKLVRDHIDFFRDRVTVTSEVGASEDEAPTPSAAVSAITEATKTFLKRLD
ncbi:DUF6731 family protein [Amnibacterium kyonggiense]|uniref:Uncharacterized protein n=1 Tax=Amnibacterium kyonggiense TaxID=595671 RepID=A0A4V3EAJ5_9MICO|nr:DUF6731 family protein [Amnibacterium kyonggiense]TDS75918.1 hypothetical protein CLV52_3029 [Amnibacterium kyonggiense]